MKCSVIAGLIIIASAAQVRAETLEDFKKAIQAKMSGYKSIQYKIHMMSEMATEQMSFKSISDQTVQYVHQGDKVLSRVDSKTSTDQKFGDTNQKSEMTSLDISDGTYDYNLSEVSGQKTAAKRKTSLKDHPSPFDVIATFAMMEKHYTLKLLPDETLDGKASYVLEMTLKEQPPGVPIGKSKLYYDKATGIVMKAVGFDDKGHTTSTMTTSDLKFDASIPADRFVFKAPPGITVKDETAKPEKDE